MSNSALPEWVEKAIEKRSNEVYPTIGSVSADFVAHNESQRQFFKVAAELGARLILERIEKTKEKDMERNDRNPIDRVIIPVYNKGRDSIRQEILGGGVK